MRWPTPQAERYGTRAIGVALAKLHRPAPFPCRATAKSLTARRSHLLSAATRRLSRGQRLWRDKPDNRHSRTPDAPGSVVTVDDVEMADVAEVEPAADGKTLAVADATTVDDDVVCATGALVDPRRRGGGNRRMNAAKSTMSDW